MALILKDYNCVSQERRNSHIELLTLSGLTIALVRQAQLFFLISAKEIHITLLILI